MRKFLRRTVFLVILLSLFFGLSGCKDTLDRIKNFIDDLDISVVKDNDKTNDPTEQEETNEEDEEKKLFAEINSEEDLYDFFKKNYGDWKKMKIYNEYTLELSNVHKAEVTLYIDEYAKVLYSNIVARENGEITYIKNNYVKDNKVYIEENDIIDSKQLYSVYELDDTHYQNAVFIDYQFIFEILLQEKEVEKLNYEVNEDSIKITIEDDSITIILKENVIEAKKKTFGKLIEEIYRLEQLEDNFFDSFEFDLTPFEK